jgi:hypothetical protein
MKAAHHSAAVLRCAVSPDAAANAYQSTSVAKNSHIPEIAVSA